jgi:hypothetical protein
MCLGSGEFYVEDVRMEMSYSGRRVTITATAHEPRDSLSDATRGISDPKFSFREIREIVDAMNTAEVRVGDVMKTKEVTDALGITKKDLSLTPVEDFESRGSEPKKVVMKRDDAEWDI